MSIYAKILNNQEYLETMHKIDNIKFITDGKWDWEHGLGHSKRVAQYVKKILFQLQADDRTIDLGMSSALLHDIGLIKGKKQNHAIESSLIFPIFVKDIDLTKEEVELIKNAIANHSNGNQFMSLIGLSLVLADKLDVTYHRTINSSIQDTMNKEIQKIKKVDITITNNSLILKYFTAHDFNINILRNWDKAILIPIKIATYLNKKFYFFINDKETDYNTIL